MGTRRRNDVLLKAIGNRLRELRLAKGLSQDVVYIDTDIHIARVEMGKYNITISTLSDLCDYYGITLDQFFKSIKKK
ncbi:MAG: helix-turn-helix domain-containing protein [Prevotellaceae bacterium]|jgi:transcriptional regulator with XRE-family HTH domain|nr:helix-turn-helix domain-containing protein [Prevotellaceae bacterium]